MAYSKELYSLYNNLVNGEQYGKFDYYDYYHGRPLYYPGFTVALYKHNYKPLFCWSHYGSSANKAKLKELQWILTNIFNMTAKDFMTVYLSKTEYNRMKEAINQCITDDRLLL